jgi:MazG family protein
MTGERLEKLLDIMRLLRDRDLGCPWDVEQTFATIAPYTIEEAYEVADAIDREDWQDLKDELGDLLLQVVFHARMAEEQKIFDFADVVEAICTKMVRRHPHVFAVTDVNDAAAQTDAWERHKAAERAERLEQARDAGDPVPESVLDGVPKALPALSLAYKLQKRAAQIGFDWPDASGALAKVTEETDELAAEMTNGAEPGRLEDEIGDLLFASVNVARKLRIDPETALRRSSAKFERRFRIVETQANSVSSDLSRASLAELDRLWEDAKAALAAYSGE